MTIEAYTTLITRIYVGLLLLCIPAGILWTVNRIRRRTWKCWWIFLYGAAYLLVAICSTGVASIAYDDPADPNYWIYESWQLRDFLLQDMKTFLAGLSLGILLYLIFERKECKKAVKRACAAVLVFLLFLFAAVTGLSMVRLL